LIKLKVVTIFGPQWLTPGILATVEAEMGRIWFEPNLGK
jgi:hypothetical protein